MKQKDIALIILIAGIACVVSFFASRAVFASSAKTQQTAEVVDAISTEFKSPSEMYFNSNSINSTQLIQIGDGGNQNPFSSGQ